MDNLPGLTDAYVLATLKNLDDQIAAEEKVIDEKFKRLEFLNVEREKIRTEVVRRKLPVATHYVIRVMRGGNETKASILVPASAIAQGTQAIGNWIQAELKKNDPLVTLHSFYDAEA